MKTRGNVLLVEDFTDLAATYRSILEEARFSVDVVATKTAAIAMLRAKLYDIALVDLQLKDDYTHKGGQDVLEYIVQLKEGTKAFALSATAEIGDAISSYRLGIVDFLRKTKVTSAENLVGPIEMVLKKHGRVYVGGYENFTEYLAAPTVKTIWEAWVHETLGCSYDVGRTIVSKSLTPFAPLLRTADGQASVTFDRDKKALFGGLWSKCIGSGIWFSAAAVESSIVHPPGGAGGDVALQLEVQGIHACVRKMSISRDVFVETARDAPWVRIKQ